MLKLTDIFTHTPDCVVREIDEGLIIMPPLVTKTHSLNGMSAFIWQQINGERDLAAILVNILAEYEVAEDQARADLLSFGQDLLAAGLVSSVTE